MEDQIVTQSETVAGATENLSVADGVAETGAGATGNGPDDVFDPETRLSIRQMRLVEALVSNADIQAACKVADVGRTTAHRWLKEPAFQEELTRQRDAIFMETLTAVKSHATQAVTQLAEMMGATENGVRRKVCTDILDRALKVHHLQNIDKRLKVLERNMKLQNNAQRRSR